MKKITREQAAKIGEFFKTDFIDSLMEKGDEVQAYYNYSDYDYEELEKKIKEKYAKEIEELEKKEEYSELDELYEKISDETDDEWRSLTEDYLDKFLAEAETFGLIAEELEMEYDCDGFWCYFILKN